METREGMIKCEGCQKAFDVDLLQYEDEQEKFGCPECGYTKFRPLLEEEDIPIIEKPQRPPDPLGILREMTQLMREAHDQHIYGPDDEHDEDCRYCRVIAEAEEVLKKF